MTWHRLEPCDESFFEQARFVYRYPVLLQADPARVWSALTSERSMADWGLGIRSLRWTSPRPFGVGTTREVVLAGGVLAIREHFFRWEDGRRKSFYGTEITRGLVSAFAEDYVVEPVAEGTRFTWTIAFEPTERSGLLLRASAPLNQLSFRSVPYRARRYFAKDQ
jgi:Polyketide cyclase / dehydrase and lipid transport